MAGRVALAVLLSGLALPALAQTPTAAAPPPSCVSPAHRAFDFWVGYWDVYPTKQPSKLVAHSLIERLYQGCAIRENWMPLSGSTGGSLNSYVGGDVTDGWRQTWVGSGGERVDFKGGWNGKAMVLTGYWAGVLGPGQGAITRMTYTRAADGSVRQFGETTSDDGKTWTPSFDFTYRPAKEPSPPPPAARPVQKKS